MTAALLNGINQAIANSVNSVDNTQIGPAGIYASQIIPVNAAQGTFGGSIGYTFGPYATSVTPLNATSSANATAATMKINMGTSQTSQGMLISGNTSATGTALAISSLAAGQIGFSLTGASGQTADLLDVSTSAAKAFSVASSGAVAAGTPTASLATLGDLGAARSSTTGVLFLGSSGNSRLDFGNSVSSQFAFSGGGLLIEPTINASNTLGYVPPVYTNAGAATASTAHIIQGTVTASGGTTAVNFTNSAVFSSSTSFTTYVFDQTAAAVVNLSSQSSTNISWVSTNGHVYVYLCVGT